MASEECLVCCRYGEQEKTGSGQGPCRNKNNIVVWGNTDSQRLRPSTRGAERGQQLSQYGPMKEQVGDAFAALCTVIAAVVSILVDSL